MTTFSEGRDRTRSVSSTAAGLIGGDHQGATGDDLVGERLERLVDLVHRGVVRVVVQLDVEDDRDLGVVLLEAAVALVRLGDEDRALAVRGVGAEVGEVAADGVRGVEVQLGQGDGQHRRGGRLAVRTGHRDGAQPAHERGERVGAVDDGDRQLGGAQQLRVVGADGAGDDHARGVVRQMSGGVPDVDGRPQRPQCLGGTRLLGVAARDLGAALGEDLRDARHSGAADADEVRPFHGGRNTGCHACVSQRSMRVPGSVRGARPAYSLCAKSLSTGTPTL